MLSPRLFELKFGPLKKAWSRLPVTQPTDTGILRVTANRNNSGFMKIILCRELCETVIGFSSIKWYREREEGYLRIQAIL